LTEETFGPVLCIDTFEDEAEAISCANNSPFSLSCSIWTGSQVRGRRVANQVNAGTCAVNDAIRNIANPFASFGGNRNSGHGRYHGPQGLFAFSRIKSVMITGDKTTRERHWFPYTQRSYSILSKILSLRHRSAGLLGWASRILFLALCFLLLPLAVGAQELKQGHLKIDVAIPRGSHGKVAYLIFTSQDGFPNNKSKSVRGGFVNMNGDAEHLTIDAGKLPAGRYAVSVYQDLNGNGKLDSGAFGIPNEPVGISNNPKIRYGPPRFDDSAFVLGESDQTISIVLAR
jgi:4,4'-diapolycopenoate synthase